MTHSVASLSLALPIPWEAVITQSYHFDHLNLVLGQRHFVQNFSDDESGKEDDGNTTKSSTKSKSDFSLRFLNFEKLRDL